MTHETPKSETSESESLESFSPELEGSESERSELPDNILTHSVPQQPEAVEEISKSQRKRDADSIRDLGARLAELSSKDLASIELPEDVQSAIEELSRIKSNSARKRQLGFLAKRLRNVDVQPMEDGLERISQRARASTMGLHLVERWRDRLLGDTEGESARDALTAFMNDYPTVDRQQIRQLQAQALKERKINRPPAAARALFKLVRVQVAVGTGALY